MKRILLPLLAVFLFGSCAGQKNQFLEKKYQNSRTTASVSVLTIDQDTFIDTLPNHKFGSFGSEVKSHFKDQLASILIRQTRSKVAGVIDNSMLQPAQFKVSSYPVKNDTLLIVSPIPGKTIANSDPASSFVLILDQFHFLPVENESGESSYAGHENESETFMFFQTKYLIWDNERGEAAAWGDVTSKKQMYPEQNRMEMYSDLVSDAFYQIVEKSPFVPLCAPFIRYGTYFYPCRAGGM